LVKGGYLLQDNRGKNNITRRPKNEPPQCFYVVPVDALLDGIELNNTTSSNNDNAVEQ
jgi:hypothetical protein